MGIRHKSLAAIVLLVVPVAVWAWPASAASGSRTRQLLSDGPRWTTHGPTGGRVGAIAFDPFRPHTVYAASNDGGGLFRSTTDGRTWRPSNDGFLSDVDSFEALLVVSDPPQVFAGAEYGGVYRSDDHGRHWAPMNTGLPELVIVLSLVMDDESGVVYAGTSFGLYRSTDRGATWNHVPGIGLPDRAFVTALTLVPEASGHLVARPRASSRRPMGGRRSRRSTWPRSRRDR